MAQLTKNGWPALRSLNLSFSRLGADGMHHLVGGLWPDLMHLDLSNNSLDEEAMFLMSDVGDKWPNLETLDLRLVQNFHHYNLTLVVLACSHPLYLLWTALPHISLLAWCLLDCFASHQLACLVSSGLLCLTSDCLLAARTS